MPTLRLSRLLRRNVAPTSRPSGSGIGGNEPRPTRRAGVLDLDHVGAEAGEQLGGVGEGLHLLGGQDADAVERLAVVGGAGVRDVSELHARQGTARM